MLEKLSFINTDKEFLPATPSVCHILFSILSVFALSSIVTISAIEHNVALAQPSSIDNRLNHTNANNNTNNILYVSGTAVDRVKPDRLSISIGVETTNNTAQAALASNSLLMSSIISSLRENGIRENETTTSQFTLRPNYNYSESGYILNITGFTATNSLEIQSSRLQNASLFIDAAVAAGANNINNIGFFVSADRLDEVKNNLIKDAILKARQKADIASSTLGLQIVGIKSISIDMPDYLLPLSTPQPFGREIEQKASLADVAPPTPILSGEREVTVSTNIVFLIGK